MEDVELELWSGPLGDPMSTPLNENTFNRLAKALMMRHRIPHEEAVNRLSELRLRVICDEESLHRVAYQAALLTAVNTGVRSFLGGVSVSMPAEVPVLLPWPGATSLNAIVQELGGDLAEAAGDFDATVVLGEYSSRNAAAIRVLCDGWRGGIQPADVDAAGFEPGEDFALGGVLAGSLAVEQAFLNACGISSYPLDRPMGLSLWRPDKDWLAPEAAGPRLQYLPRRLWLIGLGHLGQAYLWSLGLLPYPNPGDAGFMLQDFDRVAQCNWTAGLICSDRDTEEYKTRVAARWLERRGFKTTITERPYDKNMIRTGDEPFVALCGVDVPAARRLLEDAGFDLVVECGVGSSLTDFDWLKIHTFPGASKKALDIWPATRDALQLRDPSPAILESLEEQEDCGILASTLENTSVSASFVGAAAGAIVVGEILRALHQGPRYELIYAHLRSLENRRCVLYTNRYRAEVAKAGFIAVGEQVHGHVPVQKEPSPVTAISQESASLIAFMRGPKSVTSDSVTSASSTGSVDVPTRP